MGYKEKIEMKFNVAQLERIIIALINNGYNKKFANNVKNLFNLFSGQYNDNSKEVRIHIIKQIAEIIIKNNIETKEAILSFLDTDGKYYDEIIGVLNELYEEVLPENELNLLDRIISNQLKYSAIVEKSTILSDMLVNIQNENYDDLGDAVSELENELETINREIKHARESLKDSRSDMSLSSSSFVNVLGNIIQKERNPSARVKTGLQYLNTMLNGRI